jgi:hypothetical protein
MLSAVANSMLENPFLHPDTTVTPSLNRLVIADLPGIWLPEEVRGRRGYELLSVEALAQLIRGEMGPFLPEEGVETWPALWTWYMAQLAAQETSAGQAAAAIAAAYGRRLAYLLLTLQRADPVNQAARGDWGPEHWAYWQSMRNIGIAGGLCAGPFGRMVHASAAALLAENRCALRLFLAPQPAQIALLGMAALLPPGNQRMLVCDFGQTRVKCAVAHRYGYGLQLETLPARDSACGDLDALPLDERSLREFRDQLVAWITQHWRDQYARAPLSDHIGVAVAAYLRGGHPFPGFMSCYGRLQLLTPNLASHLEAELRSTLQHPIQLHLYHDGAAAALAFAGNPQTAVITLGTALGVGFAPPNELSTIN